MMRWRLLMLTGLLWLALAISGQADSAAPVGTIGQSSSPSDAVPESPFGDKPVKQESPGRSAAGKPSPDIGKLMRDWQELQSRLALPIDRPRRWLTDQFDRLAWESGQTAGTLTDASEQLAAREISLGSLAAAHECLSRQGDEQGQQIRLAQVKLAAAALIESRRPDALALADRWMRWFEFQQSWRGRDSSDARLAAALSGLSKMADPDHPSHQIALLALADHLGRSGELLNLCRSMQNDDASLNASVKRYIREQLPHRHLLGRRFSAQLRLDDSRLWSSASLKGRWLLIHFYVDWHRPSMDQAAAIGRYRRQIGADRLEVLSVGLWPDPLSQTSGPSVAPPQADWPVYPQAEHQVALSQLFRITRLPRLVLVDPQGRIVSISDTLAPLAQLAGSSPPIAPTPLPMNVP